jgi:hypothetical protein
MHRQNIPHEQNLRGAELIGGVKEILMAGFAAYAHATSGKIAEERNPESGHLELYDNYCNQLGRNEDLCIAGYVDCSESLEIVRAAMPQFTTFGEVLQVVESLKTDQAKGGVKFNDFRTTTISWSSIEQHEIVFKPIQNQISGVIEGKICHAYTQGKWDAKPSDVAVILVSSPETPNVKFVVDGHHRAFGWMLSKESGWHRDNQLPVYEFIINGPDSRDAAAALFWHMYYKLPELFKGYGIPDVVK